MLRFKARRRQSPALKPQGELTASERRVIRMMMDAMREVRDQVTRNLSQIADAVAHQSESRIIDLVTVDPWYDMQARLEEELLGEVLDAGSRVRLPAIRKATLDFAFDRSRPESAAWARSQSANLVREITDSQRGTIRDVIAFGQQSGLSPQDTARAIQQVVGLTENQSEWVRNFYDREVRANLERGMDMRSAFDAANGPTARYQEQIHSYRAMTIARTEIMRANSEGRQEAWRQGVEGGWISPAAEKEWIAEDDACDICLPINGMRVGLSDDFPEGEPPAHPNCRCDVLLVPEPIPEDLAAMSDEELDSLIADLMNGELVPTEQVPEAEAAVPTGERAIDGLGYYSRDSWPEWAITRGLGDALDDLPADRSMIGMRMDEDGQMVPDIDDLGAPGTELSSHYAAIERIGEIVDDELMDRLPPDLREKVLLGVDLDDAEIDLLRRTSAEVIADVRPMDDGEDAFRFLTAADNMPARTRPALQDSIDGLADVLGLYPRAWIDRMRDMFPQTTIGSSGRGFNNLSGHLTVSSSGPRGLSTLLHEIGHSMEMAIPGLVRLEWATLQSRALKIKGGANAGRIKGLRVFYSDERCLSGHTFRQDYTARVYETNASQLIGALQYGFKYQAFELFTTGLQATYPRRGDDLGYGDLDRKFQRIILGLLMGL